MDSGVSGRLALLAQTRDDDGQVSRVELTVDGVELQIDDAPPFTFAVETTRLSDDDHVVQARAVKDDGSEASVRRVVRVQNCDVDGDGFRATSPTCGGEDCDDASAESHPGAIDDCDGIDQNCDGHADDGFLAEICGVGACAATRACVGGLEQPCVEGQPQPDTNCNDVDDDCDGATDEDYVPVRCGAVGRCAAESACRDGVEVACAPDLSLALPDDRHCNGVDDDCDGVIDNGATCGMYQICLEGECRDTPVDLPTLAVQATDDDATITLEVHPRTIAGDTRSRCRIHLDVGSTEVPLSNGDHIYVWLVAG